MYVWDTSNAVSRDSQAAANTTLHSQNRFYSGTNKDAHFELGSKRSHRFRIADTLFFLTIVYGMEVGLDCCAPPVRFGAREISYAAGKQILITQQRPATEEESHVC